MTNELEFGVYLKNLRKEAGLTIRQLEEKSGVSNAYLSQLENGKRGLPSPEILRKIYKPLDVDYHILMEKAGHITSELDPETKKIIQMNSLSELITNAKDIIFPLVVNDKGIINEETANYFLEEFKENLNEVGQDEIENLLYNPDFFELIFKNLEIDEKIELLNILVKDFVERDIDPNEVLSNTIKPDNKIPILRVPILGHIAAGQPIFADEHIEEWTEIPNMWNLGEKEVIVLKVKGDSMIGSRIYEGDKVVVKLQQDVENGEIAVVNVNGDEATLKKVKKAENGQIILYPDNPKYEPIFINNEKARIIGKVIQVMFEP